MTRPASRMMASSAAERRTITPLLASAQDRCDVGEDRVDARLPSIVFSRPWAAVVLDERLGVGVVDVKPVRDRLDRVVRALVDLAAARVADVASAGISPMTL